MIVMFITFKLIKEASIKDFLFASEELNNGYMSKQKGYISWKQLKDGDTWADLITWETMEDAKKILEASNPNSLAEKFYSFIDCDSCKINLYSVEKNYELEKQL